MRIELHRLKPIGAVAVAERLEGVALNWVSTQCGDSADHAGPRKQKVACDFQSAHHCSAYEKVIPENPARP